MNTAKTFTVPILLTLLLLLSTIPVGATTVSECQDLISALETSLDGTEIGGKNVDRTRAGLEGKLGGASIKLDQAKFDDAIQKLEDFKNKVLGLAGSKKPKMAQEDADALASDADDAIACVEALIAG